MELTPLFAADFASAARVPTPAAVQTVHGLVHAFVVTDLRAITRTASASPVGTDTPSSKGVIAVQTLFSASMSIRPGIHAAAAA